MMGICSAVSTGGGMKDLHIILHIEMNIVPEYWLNTASRSQPHTDLPLLVCE